MLGKASTDDELIAALREELSTTQHQLATMRKEMGARGNSHSMRETVESLPDGGSAEKDAAIVRLERESKRKADQIDRQEAVIRQLRLDISAMRRVS